MNIQLANAFNVLRKARAQALPPASRVEAVTKGIWKGKTTNRKTGEKHQWSLIKNSETSYNVYC